MNNLIICTASIHPNPEDISFPHIEREKQYRTALISLSSNIKDTKCKWQISYNENTLSDLNQIKDPILHSILTNLNSTGSLKLWNNNKGIINKGAGEHAILQSLAKELDFTKMNWVVFFTARYLTTSPWFYEKILELQEYDFIGSQAPQIYLDLRTVKHPGKDWYMDTLYAMKGKYFDMYVKSLDPANLEKERMDSERHLFSFINNHRIKTHLLPSLGILRYDYGERKWSMS